VKTRIGHFIPKGYRAVRYGEEFQRTDVHAGRKFWGDAHMLSLGETFSNLIGQKHRMTGCVGSLIHSELRNRIVRKKASVFASPAAEQRQAEIEERFNG
jgi:hypothetical protein